MRFYRIGFCIVIILLLFLPIIQGSIGIIDLPGVIENRRLTSFIDISESSFKTFPAMVDRYLDDNYGFRTFLIKTANTIRLKIFQVKQLNEIIVGKDNWLFFYSKTDGNTIADYKKTNRFNQRELRYLAHKLSLVDADLKRMGIDLVIVFVPNKGSVYPEYLPDHLQVPGVSCYDELVAYLRDQTDATIIDVKDDLLAAKENSDMLLYEPNGSHWNLLGGYIGYLSLVERLRVQYPRLNPKRLDGYEIRQETQGHDLENMIGVFGYGSPIQPVLYHRGKKVEPFTFQMKNILDRTVVKASYASADHLPKTVIFRDSYFNNILPFLADHFSSAVIYRWHDGILNNSAKFNEIIEHDKPKLVIIQMVERSLHRLHFFIR